MPSPYSPRHLLIFVAVLIILVAFVQVGAISIAFDRLGLSSESAFLLLFCSLFGSAINLPLFTVRAEPGAQNEIPWHMRGLLRPLPPKLPGRTLIAINVGGGLIPLVFSAYLLLHNPIALGAAITGVAVVASVSYLVSRPLHGIGIGMPIFVAPIAAALMAYVLQPEQSAPLAYVCGTLGVLVGADLLRLKDVGGLGTPVAAIGGAGTFDGIFITGIFAVLLAA
jgi:uncharacterized membrane protein